VVDKVLADGSRRATAATKDYRRGAEDAEKSNTNCDGCPVPLCGTGRYKFKGNCKDDRAGGTPALPTAALPTAAD